MKSPNSCFASRSRYIALFLFSVVTWYGAVSASTKPAVIQADKTLTVLLLDREIYLEIATKPKEGLEAALKSYVTPSSQNKKKDFLVSKGFRSRSPVYRFPWDNLTCEARQLAVEKLFPSDKATTDGWRHVVTHTGQHGETLWRISTWFSGSGSNARKLAQSNKLNPQKLAAGDTVVIPAELLQECFKSRPDYPIVVNGLQFKKDGSGEYAEYILREGQTIYSMVLKYTPRVTADEVLSASTLILQRSGLRDFRFIPADSILKIPSDILSPQFLPPNDPRRIQFEETDRESSQFRPTERARALDGVTVILDAGHGGVDPGSIGKGGVKEDEYAYDVMCRVKRKLETETKARVFVTIEDEETGFTPRNSRVLTSGKNRERILTQPPYLIQDSAIALNFRWILSNHIYSHHTSAASRQEKVVFTSFHADSLHVSAQGLMVYIPGADYYSGNITKSDKVILKRKEAQSGGNKVVNKRRDRLQAEGFSNAFASRIREQCESHQLKMHSNQPIRKFVVRNRRSWVPAILRYCKTPTRILIELANLQNQEDLQNIMSPEYRESLAEMYVNALKLHFSD